MQFFEPLRRIINNTAQQDMKQLLRLLFLDADIQELVIELNTQNQLFEKGIDSEGVSLDSIGGGYAPATVFIKTNERTPSQPVDRITLKDTGEFYESFRVLPQSDGILITAETLKDGKDLQIRWGADILGLTEESKKMLIFNLIPLLINEAKKKIKH